MMQQFAFLIINQFAKYIVIYCHFPCNIRRFNFIKCAQIFVVGSFSGNWNTEFTDIRDSMQFQRELLLPYDFKCTTSMLNPRQPLSVHHPYNHCIRSKGINQTKLHPWLKQMDHPIVLPGYSLLSKCEFDSNFRYIDCALFDK